MFGKIIQNCQGFLNYCLRQDRDIIFFYIRNSEFFSTYYIKNSLLFFFEKLFVHKVFTYKNLRAVADERFSANQTEKNKKLIKVKVRKKMI